MYEVFKILQKSAEEIGTVKEITVHDGDRIWSDGVKISGVTADGSAFELNLTVTKQVSVDE